VSHLVDHHRHWALYLLFALVMLESFGVPLPGETALVAAGVLASQGVLTIWEVIVVAAAAAIVGDNVGYLLGRYGGRKLINRWEFVERYAERALPPSERFFDKHGPKAVFFGRFIAVLRVTAAWLAGLSHMQWWRFFAWNAAGGIIWATGVSLLAYWAGKAVAEAVGKYGLYAVVALLVLGALGYLALRVWRKRVIEEN
jgi:membrane protein DedA with SNARE-associated domain